MAQSNNYKFKIYVLTMVGSDVDMDRVVHHHTIAFGDPSQPESLVRSSLSKTDLNNTDKEPLLRMRTRSAVHALSASFLPPMSPNLVNQAQEVSNISPTTENSDVSWSSQGVERRDQPAVRIGSSNCAIARMSPHPSLEEGQKESGSENIGLGSGSHDPLAQGAVDDDRFVTAVRYVKNLKGNKAEIRDKRYLSQEILDNVERSQIPDAARRWS